jgi:transketolase
VIRPGDANEVAEAWRIAILNVEGPTALLLSRQGVPTIDRSVYAPATGLQKGAYILADLGECDPELILMASGSEVQLIVDAGAKLATEGKNVRLVSFPSWELFAKQDKAYQNSVLPPELTARVSIEAGVSMGWDRWVGPEGKIIAVDRYGASAPFKTIYEKFGITTEAVVSQALELLS